MALIPGSVRVAGFLAPSDSTDTYAVTDETYNRGGYRTVADIAARDAITPDRRKEGMMVRVSGTSETYILIGGILDANWSLVTFGGSTTTTLQVLAVTEGATTPNPGAPTLIWSSTTGTLLVWTGTAWISTISDPDLLSLADLNTTGILVRSAPGTIVTRSLAGTPGQIQIQDSDGVATGPTIALTNTGVNVGTYPKVTVDAQGRVTAGSALSVADIPADYLNLFNENFSTGGVANATGTNSVAIGDGATASAENSLALGARSSAQAPNSTAIGEFAIARHQGAVVQAAGRFVVSGDAQIGSYLLKGATTSNIPRQLYLDGPSGTIPLIIPDNSTWTYKITITAHRTDVNDGHAGYFIKGVIYRGSGPGTTSMQGSAQVEIISRSNQTWSINTSADNVNGCLAVTVTGEAGKTIRWLAHVETVELTA